MMTRRLSRRSFLQVTGASLTLASLRHASAADANSKLNVATVGCGGMGWGDLNQISSSPHVNIVALCDVDESANHLGRAAEKFPHAKKFTDWRRLLDEAKRFDAVQVSTPDHMHAPIVMAALLLGKHVYSQKPLTHTVLEARRLTEAAKKAGVVTQMGNQIQSYVEYRSAVRLIQDGAIGKVKEVFSWQAGSPTWPRDIDRPEGADAIPETLHWNEWLGTAPERPFKSKIYHSFNWRGWRDFSNGQLGDFGCHILDPVSMALRLGAPLTIRADAPPIKPDTWTKSATVAYQFPKTEFTAGPTINVTWFDGDGAFPPSGPLGLPDGFKLPGSGSVLVGEKGSLLVPHVGAPKLFPEDKFKDYAMPTMEPMNHYISWVNACRGEGKTGSHYGYSGPLTEAVLLGTIAIRLPGETLHWNAAEMKIAGSPKAEAMLSKPYRKGWEIPGV
ncbi:MAG: Gfo/Idh/MocA family oxidoreductase [Planctomycetales bacterium]|nr:Gfo/Idh/MocA family oxidoreductase [Planctomycetales bacterium]